MEQNLEPKETGEFGHFYAGNFQLVGTQKSQTENPNKYFNID